MEAKPRTLRIYETQDGNHPFIDWLDNLEDVDRAKISDRLERVEEGNFGDVAKIGKGVHELRIHFGPGYRVYFGNIGSVVVLLLCGGSKRTQKRDAKQAVEYWEDYKKREGEDG